MQSEKNQIKNEKVKEKTFVGTNKVLHTHSHYALTHYMLENKRR